jgi:polysaccharide export outer membrane protein
MNLLRRHWKNGLGLLALGGVAGLLAGCGSTPLEEPVFTDVPVLTGPTPAPAPTAATPGAATPGATAPAPVRSPSAATSDQPAERIHPGDLLNITFGGLDTANAIQAHQERVKEDGTVTLQLIGPVVAAGKTPGELQREIQDRYVPKYYLRLVPTVTVLDRFYYVGGEVRAPARQPWVAELTVTQAIQSVGDFTDFARRTRVQLTRTDGTTIVVNCDKIRKNRSPDPKVLPGDKIHVPRKWW